MTNDRTHIGSIQLKSSQLFIAKYGRKNRYDLLRATLTFLLQPNKNQNKIFISKYSLLEPICQIL